jgi:hypothetical protein
MTRGDRSANRRALRLFIVLCLTVLGQWCALDQQHEQHRPSEHCCLLCHNGPQATLDTVAIVYQAPVFSTAWIAPEPERLAPRQAPVTHSSSRAPPREFPS